MKQTDVSTAASYASVPTPFTRRMRTFIPYQLLRFAIINIRMIRMLARAHADAPEPGGPPKGTDGED